MNIRTFSIYYLYVFASIFYQTATAKTIHSTQKKAEDAQQTCRQFIEEKGIARHALKLAVITDLFLQKVPGIESPGIDPLMNNFYVSMGHLECRTAENYQLFAEGKPTAVHPRDIKAVQEDLSVQVAQIPETSYRAVIDTTTASEKTVAQFNALRGASVYQWHLFLGQQAGFPDEAIAGYIAENIKHKGPGFIQLPKETVVFLLKHSKLETSLVECVTHFINDQSKELTTFMIPPNDVFSAVIFKLIGSMGEYKIEGIKDAMKQLTQGVSEKSLQEYFNGLLSNGRLPNDFISRVKKTYQKMCHDRGLLNGSNADENHLEQEILGILHKLPMNPAMQQLGFRMMPDLNTRHLSETPSWSTPYAIARINPIEFKESDEKHIKKHLCPQSLHAEL